MFKLPDLPYAYNALEPHIDEATMKLHHDKHHATYVEKLNAALTGYKEFADIDIEDLLRGFDKIPQDVKTAVKNHGGGHANHSLFWTIMKPGGGGEPKGGLADAIKSTFGDFGTFKEKLSTVSVGHFGSGWGWLVVNKGKLEVIGLPNQDSPLMEQMMPIMGIDVWEHAYYLKYQNKRADYVNAWWNVINWDVVTQNFTKASK